MEPMHLIAGLGNPGAEYAKTRHNVGFAVLDKLARRWKADWAAEKKFSARMAKAECGGKKILLCQPQTFMNLSGESVAAVAAYYRLLAIQILVVVDDADLPLGEIRLRSAGGSGGHHGLDSVTQQLGTSEYPRLRVGIGRQNGLRQITGHVLGRFSAEETVTLEKVLDRAADQVECCLQNGLQKAMSQFNGAISSKNEEK